MSHSTVIVWIRGPMLAPLSLINRLTCRAAFNLSSSVKDTERPVAELRAEKASGSADSHSHWYLAFENTEAPMVNGRIRSRTIPLPSAEASENLWQNQPAVFAPQLEPTKCLTKFGIDPSIRAEAGVRLN